MRALETVLLRLAMRLGVLLVTLETRHVALLVDSLIVALQLAIPVMLLVQLVAVLEHPHV